MRHADNGLPPDTSVGAILAKSLINGAVFTSWTSLIILLFSIPVVALIVRFGWQDFVDNARFIITVIAFLSAATGLQVAFAFSLEPEPWLTSWDRVAEGDSGESLGADWSEIYFGRHEQQP